MKVTQCFCCGLRNGYLIWAVINIILRLLNAYNGFTNIANMDNPQLDEESREFLQSYRGVFIASIVWYLVSVLLCGCAITGIVQEYNKLMVPYIGVLIVEPILQTISIIYISIILTPYFLLCAIFLCIPLYDLICLVSLYKEMKSPLFSISNQDI